MCSWVKEKHEEFKKAQEKKKSKDADKSALKEISVRKEGGKKQQKGGSNGQAEPLMGYVSRHWHCHTAPTGDCCVGRSSSRVAVAFEWTRCPGYSRDSKTSMLSPSFAKGRSEAKKAAKPSAIGENSRLSKQWL